MATYVEITREDFEDWLGKTRKKWTRVQGKAGVYLLHFSPTVALSISSSIGSEESGLSVGRAAIHMRLVSSVTGQTLNKKGLGQSRFNRTTNWRVNLLKGVSKFEELYKKSQDFYDSISQVADRDAYKTEWVEKIKSAPGWESHRILSDILGKVEQGRVLSSKQEALVEKIVAELIRNAAAPAPRGPAKIGPAQVDEDVLERLREFYRAGRRKNNQWLMDRAQEWASLVKRGRRLSEKQMAIIDRELGPSARRVASLWRRKLARKGN